MEYIRSTSAAVEQEPRHGPADPDFSVACLSFSPNVQAAHESRKGSVAIIVVEWSSSALVGMCPISTSPASWLTWTTICPLERIKRQSPLIPTSFPLDVWQDCRRDIRNPPCYHLRVSTDEQRSCRPVSRGQWGPGGGPARADCSRGHLLGNPDLRHNSDVA